MPTLGDGRFSFTIESKELARGLRPSKRNPRNSRFLTKCEGAVGYDNVLQVLSEITENAIDTSAITDNWPFPQLFVFTNVIIVCGETDIYELVGNTLTLVLTVTAGIQWSAIDLFDFVYASNGKVAAIRTAANGAWSVTTALPIASAICNFNGQVVIGAPGVERV